MTFDDFKDKLFAGIIILLILGVLGLCIYACYSTRIIETVSINTTATITDIYHRNSYTTTNYRHSQYHPERNVFTFDTYWENEHVVVEESVTHNDYVTYNKNDEIQICLTKEWRADESITYSVEILK